MRYDAGQFGSFDGLDNRKAVMGLFVRLGNGLPDDLAGMRRAGVLQGLLALSGTCFRTTPVFVEPCNAVEAYNAFVAITGVLGVPVERAAVLLEEIVRTLEAKGDRRPAASC